MFQSFTGNSRRPRQVNLSGRNNNPFAAYPSPRQSSAGPGAQNTLANAQHERLLRQQERDRLNAAKAIQRHWRGHQSRRNVKDKWRKEWDYQEGMHNFITTGPGPSKQNSCVNMEAKGYASEVLCMSQLQLLLRFINPSWPDDVIRMDHFAARFLRTFASTSPQDQWTGPLLRLARITLEVLLQKNIHQLKETTVVNLLSLLAFLARIIPKDLALDASLYYQALASITVGGEYHRDSDTKVLNLLMSCVLGLLQPLTSNTLNAYEGFATSFLTTAQLQNHLGTLNILAASLNPKLLASSLASSLKSDSMRQTISKEERLWLLAYFIHFHRQAYGLEVSRRGLPEQDYITVVSVLLCSVADQITARIDLDDTKFTKGDERSSSREGLYEPLPHFIREEILSLVNQGSITNLLARTDAFSQSDLVAKYAPAPEEARLLAGFALTLLRVFPRRGDEIRMWLYLGSALRLPDAIGSTAKRLPAIKYFWNAARSTRIYEAISQDPRAVLSLLKSTPQQGRQIQASEREQEWRIILLFLELYTFVLKVMDDEEFLSGGKSESTGGAVSNLSWTKESALPLRDILNLTIFLKNLAFTMYWSASELSGTEETDVNGSIGSYFNTSSVSRINGQNKSTAARAPDAILAGVTGMSLDYLKGMVTGVLRMIYERE